MDVQDCKKFIAQLSDREISQSPPQSPIVSVCVITYQHGDYIKKCLDGILSQEVDFEYEILIGEDGSTDGTREICVEYAQKHPNKIRLFLHNQNTDFNGVKVHSYQFNALFNFFSSKGKYIAFCEGDDAWTAKNKLQKQIEFLEENSNCILTCGGYRTIYSDGKKEDSIDQPSGVTLIENGYFFHLEDHFKKWKIKFLTTTFRNRPEVFLNLLNYKLWRDVHLFYHLLKEGSGFYFCEILGDYNKHLGGMVGGLTKSEQDYQGHFIYREFHKQVKDEIIRKKFIFYILESLHYKKKKDSAFKKLNRWSLLKDALQTLKSRKEWNLFFKYFISSFY